MWHKCVGAGQCILFTSRPPRPPEFPGDHLSTCACAQREAIKTHIIHWKTNTISLTAPQRISTHTHSPRVICVRTRAQCVHARILFSITPPSRGGSSKNQYHTQNNTHVHTMVRLITSQSAQRTRACTGVRYLRAVRATITCMTNIYPTSHHHPTPPASAYNERSNKMHCANARA